MMIPREPSGLESGFKPSAVSSETASLLPNDRATILYGSSPASETSAKCRVGTNERDSSQSDESTSSCKSTQESSHNRNALSAPDSFANSPVDWVCRKVTGGWSDEISLSLQNSGSVARDHLALERTFLAYMRTSLAIASAGVALVQLFSTSNSADIERLEKYARPLGASVIAMGLVVLSIGLTRYFIVQSALVRGMFPVARLSALFMAIALTALVTVVFSILVTGRIQL